MRYLHPCGPLALATLALACAGISDVKPEPKPDDDPICGGNVVCTGAFPAGHVTWRATDGPFFVQGELLVDTLTIGAGARVIASPGAAIRIAGELIALGTAAAPVVFTAQDTLQPWQGLTGSARLTHVLLEHALTGITTAGVGSSRQSLTLEHSVVRRTQGPSIRIGYSVSATILGTTIDAACLDGMPCAAVHVVGRSFDVRFEDNQILNSGGDGLDVATVGSGSGHLVLGGGRIEGSAGIGLKTSGHSFRFDAAGPITITGGGSYPAVVHFAHAADLLLDPAAHVRWTGNARDTVLATDWGDGSTDSLTIGAALAWMISGVSGVTIGRLTLEPGAVLGTTATVSAGSLHSRGTAGAPVMISGRGRLVVGGDTAAGASHMTHTLLSGVRLEATSAPFFMEDVRGEAARVLLRAPGSRFIRSALHGAAAGGPAASLTLAASDIEVAGCEITGSSGAGILVEVAHGVRINECSIHGNTGAGVRNTAAAAVDARHNWWGDPNGPFGPAGDGVEGDVAYQPWRSTPVGLAGDAARARRW
jgi:hypothetical protein